jgi:hypothetical protein
LGMRLKTATIANNGQGSPEAWIRAVLKGGFSPSRQKGQFSVNVGVSEELLPGMHGPNSISQSLQEAEEHAKSGAGWRNDVFSVQKLL